MFNVYAIESVAIKRIYIGHINDIDARLKYHNSGYVKSTAKDKPWRLRYLAFVFLLGTYFSNMALYPKGEIYKLFFLLQNLCYLAAFLGAYAKKGGHLTKVLYPFNYFVLLNLASAHAFFKFLFRQKQVIWTPRKG